MLSELSSSPSNNRIRLQNWDPNPNRMKRSPIERNEKNTIYINESGLYSLILHSKLESAQVFKRWVTKDILPSIRKTGRCSYDDMNHTYNDSLTFKIENELDLHIKVVSNEDTSKKRIVSHKKRLPSWLSRFNNQQSS